MDFSWFVFWLFIEIVEIFILQIITFVLFCVAYNNQGDNMMNKKTYYRAEVESVDPHYNDGDTRINMELYHIERETPAKYLLRAAWENSWNAHMHWMVKNAKHPYAYETPEEAIYSLLRRKRAYLAILKNRVSYTKKTIKAAKTELNRRGWNKKT